MRTDSHNYLNINKFILVDIYFIDDYTIGNSIDITMDEKALESPHNIKL